MLKAGNGMNTYTVMMMRKAGTMIATQNKVGKPRECSFLFYYWNSVECLSFFFPTVSPFEFNRVEYTNLLCLPLYENCIAMMFDIQ